MTADAIKIKVLPNPGGVIEPNNQGNSQSLFFSWPMETDRTLLQKRKVLPNQKEKLKEYKLPYATQLVYDIVVTINPFNMEPGSAVVCRSATPSLCKRSI